MQRICSYLQSKPSGKNRKPSRIKRVVPILAALALLVVCATFGTTLIKTSITNTQKVDDESSIADPAASLSDYSWEDLENIAHMIADADSDKEALKIAGTYHLVNSDGKLLGDTKLITLSDGTQTEVRILGFREDKRANGGGPAGITFEFADVPIARRMNPTDDTVGGWEASEMRSWLNDDFFNLLPEDLRSCIVEVEKQTNASTGAGAEQGDATATATKDTIWLLSMSEVYGELSSQVANKPHNSAAYDAGGTQYKLYADHEVSASNSSFCAKEGESSWWWLRSPSTYYPGCFCSVHPDGDWGESGDSSGVRGVSPAFCL